MFLPSTRTLQALVAAARLGSLAAAGAEIGMSVPALSRRLAALERDLGTRLLDRVPRGVVLTADGAAYVEHAAAPLDRLRVAGEGLRRGAAAVRLTTFPAFATRWLLPRLSDFTDRHPGIEVDVRTSVNFERLDTGAFDLAIRLIRDDLATTTPLLPIYLLPVWRAAGAPAIREPADILRRELIGPDHRPEFWREWLDGVGMDPTVDVRGVDPLLLYERTLGGQAVAIGIEPLVSDLLAAGRLRGLGDHRIRSARGLHLLTSRDPATSAARSFERWLRARCGGADDGTPRR